MVNYASLLRVDLSKAPKNWSLFLTAFPKWKTVFGVYIGHFFTEASKMGEQKAVKTRLFEGKG
jgi:hypothetical protein